MSPLTTRRRGLRTEAELAARRGVALWLGGRVISKEEQYDKLALVRSSLDMGRVYRIIGQDGK